MFDDHVPGCGNTEDINMCVRIHIRVAAQLLRHQRLVHQFQDGAYSIATTVCDDPLEISRMLLFADEILRNFVIPTDEAALFATGLWGNIPIEQIHFATAVGALGCDMTPALHNGLNLFRRGINAPMSSISRDPEIPSGLDEGVDDGIYDELFTADETNGCNGCAELKNWIKTVFQNYPASPTSIEIINKLLF